MPKRVFVSHAAVDKPLVEAFQRCLESGIGFTHSQVFCTSLAGQGVPAGKDFKSYIRVELQTADAAVMLITNNFYSSPFCMCELGAIWGSAKKLIPILVPPLEYKDLKAVLDGVKSFRLIDADWDQIADELRPYAADPKGAAVWNSQRTELLESVRKAIRTLPTPKSTSAVPSIAFLGTSALRVSIEQSPDTRITTVLEDGDGEFYAVVAKFRNEPSAGRAVKPLFQVSSHIVYRDENGNEIGDGVSGAHWLGQGSDSADFRVGGETRSLVVLVYLPVNRKLFVPRIKHTRGSWMGRGIEDEATEIREMPAAIRVQLLDGAEVAREALLYPKLVKGHLESTSMNYQEIG